MHDLEGPAASRHHPGGVSWGCRAPRFSQSQNTTLFKVLSSFYEAQETFLRSPREASEKAN